MNINLHAKINIFCNIIHFVAPIFMFMVPIWPLNEQVMLILFAFFSPLIFTVMFPVHCTRMKCAGRMWITTQKLSFWRIRLLYRCDRCSAEHKVVLFNPNINSSPGFRTHEVLDHVQRANK